jgi:hypothetical protein
VFSNSPCREKKKGAYVLVLASWRRCTSFIRFIFSAAAAAAPGARPRGDKKTKQKTMYVRILFGLELV